MRNIPASNAHNRYTAGRYLQSMAWGRGSPESALAWAEGQGHWLDQAQVVAGIRAAATDGITTADYPGALTPVANSFLEAMRGDSVPLRLAGLRRVPMLTRVFVNTAGVVASQVAEGAPILVLKGNWTSTTLTPRKFAGIVIQTDELVKSTSPVATLAITDDLAQATAEAENRAFCAPETTGSVLAAAPSFNGSGAAVANVDADLLQLCNLVPGAFRPGAAFIMRKETATFLSLLRGSGGAAAYPNITPQGGFLLGLPVLVTTACQSIGSPTTKIVGLLSPSEIFWADEGRVILSTSNQASIEQSDVPTGNADAGTAQSVNITSMWQSNSVATKAIRESSWYARAGSGAYFNVVGY